MTIKTAQKEAIQPNQMLRAGPRPLALHLASAATNWTSSLAALPLAKNGSLPWKKELKAEAEALANALEKQSPEALSAALGAEIRRRMADFVGGIECYQQHPYHRRYSAAFSAPATLWQDGSSALLDYGPDLAGKEVKTVLFVPSLINRGYILDLARQRSLMRYLAESGVRPLLLDWGAPVDEERNLGLDDYIA
ncbi:MAG: alpha/beta hydrolase, partial [Rhodospirillaceae bacterium]|nr:alpha/beta hydrolase [Rhodospirillaceae bacterium]